LNDLSQTSRVPDSSRKRRHRPRTGMGLFVTDQELVEILGVPADTARDVIAALDKDGSSGFPKKQKTWGDRRYLPAVEQWLDAAYGLKMAAQLRRVG
jgi:hypothetical protein